MAPAPYGLAVLTAKHLHLALAAKQVDRSGDRQSEGSLRVELFLPAHKAGGHIERRHAVAAVRVPSCMDPVIRVAELPPSLPSSLAATL